MIARRAASSLLLVCAALVYSGAHFLKPGILFPLSAPNVGQIEEEVRPLLVHMQDGRPITTNNPRQYGPTFLFVMDPIVRWAADDPARLSRALYALALAFYAASFALVVVMLG